MEWEDRPLSASEYDALHRKVEDMVARVKPGLAALSESEVQQLWRLRRPESVALADEVSLIKTRLLAIETELRAESEAQAEQPYPGISFRKARSRAVIMPGPGKRS